MKKIDLIGMALVAVLLLFVLGITFFQKEPPKKSDTAGQSGTTIQNGNNPNNEDVLEAQAAANQKAATAAVTDFASAYNTYVYGDFSNIKNLYPSMTEKLQQTEEDKVRTLEDTLTDTRYVTVQAHVTAIVTESFDPQENKLVARVSLEKNTYGGAWIENEDFTLYGIGQATKLVNRSGKTYRGDFQDLLEGTETQVYRLTALKEGEKWKISAIQRVS
jgi:hypothetical protein